MISLLTVWSAWTHSWCCRVQLPCVGALEKLGVGLSSSGEQACWLLEQVEVTDECTGGPPWLAAAAAPGGICLSGHQGAGLRVLSLAWP